MDFSNNSYPDPFMQQVHMSRDGECVSGYFFTPVLRLYWPARGKELVFTGNTVFSVGRDKNCWIQFQDTPWQQYLSRDHAYFATYGTQWTLQDHHATNRPFINGVQVAPGSTTYLNPGDVIRFAADDVFIVAGGGGSHGLSSFYTEIFNI